MILEAILLIAILATGFVLCLDKILYPRHSRLFRGKPKLVTFSQSVLPVLLIIFCLRSFTYEAFRIPSGSMKPTLVEGDLVLVDKYSFGLRLPILGYRLTPGQPQRGDIAVFRGEVDGKSAGLIKRIVGLPGDHIKYADRTLYVNGKPAMQLDIASDIDRQPGGKENKVIRATEQFEGMRHDIFMSLKNTDPDYEYGDLVVPKDAYYVIGDHRSNSHDSRYWGVVTDQKLIGKARLIAFSFDWDNRYDWPTKSVRWQRIGRVS
jgi:signal peptidase I